MRLTFYMKSGNVITQRRVKDYNVKSRGDEIVGLTIRHHKWFPPRAKILISSINLAQIECIVKD